MNVNIVIDFGAVYNMVSHVLFIPIIQKIGRAKNCTRPFCVQTKIIVVLKKMKNVKSIIGNMQPL